MAIGDQAQPVATLLDADVIIRAERGAFNLEAWLESRPDGQSQIAAITVAELWHGVERASLAYRTSREGYIRDIIRSLPILPYTETTALVHARIWAELESRGKMIGYYDLILAATALEHGCAVITFNKRHFQVVPGLNVIEPV
jgi:tRNA(fMet)-specific endonuclease VapC